MNFVQFGLILNFKKIAIKLWAWLQFCSQVSSAHQRVGGIHTPILNTPQIQNEREAQDDANLGNQTLGFRYSQNHDGFIILCGITLTFQTASEDV